MAAAAPILEPATGSAAQIEDRSPERRVEFPQGVTSLADVTYSAPEGFRPLTLDLYLTRSRAGSQATHYSIDKQRIGIWGVSAGGQLAAITGTACEAGEGESA
jgi:hypothetical protein